MNKEVLTIANSFTDTLTSQPWFGRSVYELLEEVDESKVHTKPNGTEHSMIELLWHMNVWAEFTLANLEKRSSKELKAIEENDWRDIDPKKHTWKAGLEQLKTTHAKIIELLNQSDDRFLSDMVPNRSYNFHYMLKGLVQHNIYHIGQVAYLKTRAY